MLKCTASLNVLIWEWTSTLSARWTEIYGITHSCIPMVHRVNCQWLHNSSIDHVAVCIVDRLLTVCLQQRLRFLRVSPGRRWQASRLQSITYEGQIKLASTAILTWCVDPLRTAWCIYASCPWSSCCIHASCRPYRVDTLPKGRLYAPM